MEEYHVRNHEDQLLHRHLRHTAEDIEQSIKSTGAEALIVGGHEDIVARLLSFLPWSVADKVAGTFVIDPHTMTAAQVRQRAERVADAYERKIAQQLVTRVVDLVAGGGLAAEGLAWCLLATNEKAVQHLLVHNDEQAEGKVCDFCGWLGLEGEACPVCGHSTRTAVDIIEEMVAAVVESSGSARHVYGETALSRQVVAAFLRFPVERPPG